MIAFVLSAAALAFVVIGVSKAVLPTYLKRRRENRQLWGNLYDPKDV